MTTRHTQTPPESSILTGQAFESIQTEIILEAVEACGMRCSGRLVQLNSMENRVYAVELDSDATVSDAHRARAESATATASALGSSVGRVAHLPRPTQVIVKFYRPGRWNADEILSEHLLQTVLSEENIPTPRFFPIKKATHLAQGSVPLMDRLQADVRDSVPLAQTLGKTHGMYFCVWQKVSGRAPLELRQEHLEEIGATVARMHNMFESHVRRETFRRPILSTGYFAEKALSALTSWGKIPRPLDIAILGHIERFTKGLEWVNTCIEFIPTHGDLHRLNLMQTRDEGDFWMVDFDDCMWAPDIQDLWLLASGCDLPPQGDLSPTQVALSHLMRGYGEFRRLPHGLEALVEPLRTLRMIHYMGWIANRWYDPLFRDVFSFFTDFGYWERTLADLERQNEVLQQEGLLTGVD